MTIPPGEMTDASISRVRPIDKIEGINRKLLAYLIGVLGLLGVAWFPQPMGNHPPFTFWWWVWLTSALISGIASFATVQYENSNKIQNIRSVRDQREIDLKTAHSKTEEELVSEGIRLLADERQQNLATLEALVRPLVHDLPRLVSLPETEKEPEASTILNRLIGVFAQVISSNGWDVKANYYQVKGFGRGRHLKRADQTGVHAREEFKRTTQDLESSAVVERVLAGTYTWCRDTNSEEERTTWSLEPERHRTYQAFISIPVKSGDQPIGMLSVNAAKPDVLMEHHIDFLRNVAIIIAAIDPFLGNGTYDQDNDDSAAQNVEGPQ